jgi:hypothetical protein
MQKRFYITTLILLGIMFVLNLPLQASANTTYQQIREVEFSGGKRTVNLVCADLTDPTIRIESALAKNEVGQKDTLQNIAEQLKSPDVDVIAAFNGGYFEPYAQGKAALWSTLEQHGEYVHLGEEGSVMGFTADNQVLIGNLKVRIKGSINGKGDDSQGWNAWGFNHVYGQDNPEAIAIFTPAYGKTTGPHDRCSITVDNGRVVSITKGEAVIPATGYIIVMNQGAVLSRFKIGDQVDYRLEFSRYDNKDGSQTAATFKWDQMRTTVGAGPTLIRDGKIVADGTAEGFQEADLITTRAALRSFIGVTPDNVLIMGTVPQVSIAELAEIVQKLNLVQALNLDGGLSSALYYRGQYLTGPYRQITDAIVITQLKEAPVRVQLNGRELFMATDPIMRNQRVLVPLGEVLPDLQITAQYDPTTAIITAQQGETVLKLKLDEYTVQVNGMDRSTDVPATLYNHQIYIPLHLVADAFNASLAWDPAANLVKITRGLTPGYFH